MRTTEDTLLKKMLVASLATAALALQVPAAHADPAAVDCGFNAVAQEVATGGQDTYTGAAYGYVASAGEAVTIRCTIEVDGTEVASTDVGSGNSFASTQGQITFTATETQDVKLCTWWTAGSTSGKVCAETTNTQIPPQEVIDLIADLTAGLDPIICGALKTAGVPALVNATTSVTTVSLDEDDCDIYLGSARLIDFVPYED